VKLADLIDPAAIIDQLAATSKEEAFREMIASLAAAGKVEKKNTGELIGALVAREGLGSTGIGGGLAVPHAKHDSVKDLVVTFGRSRKGIEFDALDGEPVYLVFLLLSSKEAIGQHLEALAYISKLLRGELTCRLLREAKDRAGIVAVLKEADRKLTAG